MFFVLSDWEVYILNVPFKFYWNLEVGVIFNLSISFEWDMFGVVFVNQNFFLVIHVCSKRLLTVKQGL